MKWKLTTGDVEKQTGLSKTRIYQAAAAGEIGKKFGSALMFCEADVTFLLDRKGKVGRPGIVRPSPEPSPFTFP